MHGEKEMIDEQATFEKYGYYSTDLKPKARKKIVAVCDGCGAIRYPKKCNYRDLCTACVKIGRKMPPFTDEHRHNMSAAKQGIPYEEWTGFSDRGEYCEKFNEACRKRIREKYNNQCFLCGKPQDENIMKGGKQIALSVHHYDMNKDAGCNGNLWKLVPLCIHYHGITHTPTWTTRIEYLLEYVWDI